MKATTLLPGQGQSLWLDNITRDLLQNGTLARYIAELSVTGLTSNPTIFDHAIKNSTAYDAAIRQKVDEGKSGEDLFFELALEDLTRAADLFRPISERTHGVDGWVSLEVSPLLAHDTASTLAAEMLGTRLPGADEMDAYERVLGDAMHGDSTLFAREDYVEEAWRIVDPILKNGSPIYEYEPGTWGPQDVDGRVSPPGGWQNPEVRAS